MSQNVPRPRPICTDPNVGSRAKAAKRLQPELELDAVWVLERHKPPEVEHAHGRVGHAELVEMGDPTASPDSRRPPTTGLPSDRRSWRHPLAHPRPGGVPNFGLDDAVTKARGSANASSPDAPIAGYEPAMMSR